MKIQDMSITGYTTNKQTGDLWLFPEDRSWKARVNGDGDVTVIQNGHEVYRAIKGRTFNSRTRQDITGGWMCKKYITPLVRAAQEAATALA